MVLYQMSFTSLGLWQGVLLINIHGTRWVVETIISICDGY